ncbi:MAG: PKD domain-containing protein [Deltaproteobacteria bacterium]|nr:PKD domain-containing protein [Deltaproteobacteria bacterium]
MSRTGNLLMVVAASTAALLVASCRSCTEAPPPRRARPIEGKLPPAPRAVAEPTATQEPARCAVIAMPELIEGGAPFRVELPAEGGCTDGPASFEWDFGDGSARVKQQSPTHVYEKPGEYTAKVTISDPEGRTDSDRVTITVTP